MKMFSAPLILATLAASLMPAGAAAQQRVRLTLPLDTLAGVVTRMSADQVELSLEGGGSRVFRRDEVLRMERGVEHRLGPIGSLLGFVAGGVALALADPPFVPLGLIGGGLVGYGIGSSKTLVVWETVPGWTVYWMMPVAVRDTDALGRAGTGLRFGARVGFR